MSTLAYYVSHRYGTKSRGFGEPVRFMWLDALLFGVKRWCTLHSPFFRTYCRKIDRIFTEEYAWEHGRFTEHTGLDCWIDGYWEGVTPEDAAGSEVSYWEDC